MKGLGLAFDKCRKVRKYRVGWVTFASKADMEAASAKITGHVVKGNRLKASLIASAALVIYFLDLPIAIDD